jgi:hypothetical protein
MSISVLAISFDARDAAELANFWAQALHRTVNDGATEDFASIAAGDDAALGPFLMFHKVPEGKTVKNRVHFDLKAAEVLTEADRLTSLGAKQIRLPRTTTGGSASSTPKATSSTWWRVDPTPHAAREPQPVPPTHSGPATGQPIYVTPMEATVSTAPDTATRNRLIIEKALRTSSLDSRSRRIDGVDHSG